MPEKDKDAAAEGAAGADAPQAENTGGDDAEVGVDGQARDDAGGGDGNVEPVEKAGLGGGDEEEEESLETRYARAAKDRLLAEADRIACRALDVPRHVTRVLRIADDIDQPEFVRTAVVERLAAKGFVEHPRGGTAGSYTLHLHPEDVPETYPLDLWVDVPEKRALSGHYRMVDDTGDGEGTAAVDGEEQETKEKITAPKRAQHGGGEWPMWRSMAHASATLFSSSEGRWMIGADATVDEGWVVGDEPHLAQPSLAAQEVTPAELDSKMVGGMPQLCHNWMCHSDAGWRASRGARMYYVPSVLHVHHPANPALRGRYRLTPFPINHRPSWVHDHLPEVRLLSLPGSSGWMLGRVAPHYQLEMLPEVTDVVGWVCSMTADSSELPDKHKTGWLGYTEGAGGTWASLGFTVSRHRARAPARFIYRLLQSRHQELAYGRQGVRDEVEARAQAMADAVLALLDDGTKRGKTVYNEVIPAVPDGDAAYDLHVLERAGEILGGDHELEGIRLELVTHQLLGVDYHVPFKSVDDELEAVVKRIVAKRAVAKPGEWIHEDVTLPMDALAEALEDAGITEFNVSQSPSWTTVAIRCPWDVKRELWDHGEIDHLKFGLPDLARTQHKAVSPQRDATGFFLEENQQLRGRSPAHVRPTAPARPPCLGEEFIQLARIAAEKELLRKERELGIGVGAGAARGRVSPPRVGALVGSSPLRGDVRRASTSSVVLEPDRLSVRRRASSPRASPPRPPAHNYPRPNAHVLRPAARPIAQQQQAAPAATPHSVPAVALPHLALDERDRVAGVRGRAGPSATGYPQHPPPRVPGASVGSVLGYDPVGRSADVGLYGPLLDTPYAAVALRQPQPQRPGGHVSPPRAPHGAGERNAPYLGGKDTPFGCSRDGSGSLISGGDRGLYYESIPPASRGTTPMFDPPPAGAGGVNGMPTRSGSMWDMGSASQGGGPHTPRGVTPKAPPPPVFLDAETL